jgi:hypothetical protein
VSAHPSPAPGSKKCPGEATYSALLVVVLLLVLPYFGAVAMMIGSAVGLAGYVFLMPDHFRTRSGSLAPAIVLVAVFILAMVVCLALSQL